MICKLLSQQNHFQTLTCSQQYKIDSKTLHHWDDTQGLGSSHYSAAGAHNGFAAHSLGTPVLTPESVTCTYFPGMRNEGAAELTSYNKLHQNVQAVSHLSFVWKRERNTRSTFHPHHLFFPAEKMCRDDPEGYSICCFSLQQAWGKGELFARSSDPGVEQQKNITLGTSGAGTRSWECSPSPNTPPRRTASNYSHPG